MRPHAVRSWPPLLRQQRCHWRQPILPALPAAELDHAAFSGSEEEQELRLGAYEGAWDTINDRLQVRHAADRMLLDAPQQRQGT